MRTKSPRWPPTLARIIYFYVIQFNTPRADKTKPCVTSYSGICCHVSYQTNHRRHLKTNLGPHIYPINSYVSANACSHTLLANDQTSLHKNAVQTTWYKTREILCTSLTWIFSKEVEFLNPSSYYLKENFSLVHAIYKRV